MNLDRDTIYLDNDEEITSVVDKLKSSDFGAIDLVIPKEAIILQSVVNLKLLKKQAESLSKEITIVTQDRVGKKLAEQIGIPVVGKPGEEPKEVRMSEVEPAKEALSEEDIEFRKAPVKKDLEEKPEEIEFENPIEETKEVIADEPQDIEPQSETPKRPITPKTKKKSKKPLFIAAGLLGIVLLGVAYVYIPLANINISLAATPQQVDFDFSVDKGVSSLDTEKQVLPGTQVTEETEKSQNYPATGKKKVGTKATGTVTLYNSASSIPFSQTINGGTSLVASNGLVFKVNNNSTVPGYTDPGTGKIPGKLVNVSVTAVDVGESYNIKSGLKFSIPNKANFSATSEDDFTGGSSKDVKYVTQADINTAKEDMAKQIEVELKRIVTEKIDRSQRFLDTAYKITQESATPSVSVNGEADEFELKAKAKIDALVFKDEDLTKLAEKVLGDKIGSTKEIVEKDSLTSAAELISSDFGKGTMQIKVSGEAYISTKLDQAKIKADLSGDPAGSATDYLKNLDGVTNVEIKSFPSFYNRMPRIIDHIYIKVTVDKQG